MLAKGVQSARQEAATAVQSATAVSPVAGASPPPPETAAPSLMNEEDAETGRLLSGGGEGRCK